MHTSKGRNECRTRRSQAKIACFQRRNAYWFEELNRRLHAFKGRKNSWLEDNAWLEELKRSLSAFKGRNEFLAERTEEDCLLSKGEMDAGLEELSAGLDELKRRLHAFKWRMNASLEELERKLHAFKGEMHARVRTRSKHKKVQTNAYLTRTHRCKFSGKSPLSSHKTTLKQQINGQKR